jgi:hypothetical protein
VFKPSLVVCEQQRWSAFPLHCDKHRRGYWFNECGVMLIYPARLKLLQQSMLEGLAQHEVMILHGYPARSWSVGLDGNLRCLCGRPETTKVRKAISTEGDKDHMSQRKTKNTFHIAAPQAPHPINFFFFKVIAAYNYRVFLTNNSGLIFSTFDLLLILDFRFLYSRLLYSRTLDSRLSILI